MRVRLVGQQPEVTPGHATLRPGRDMLIEQRYQLRIVAGLPGGQPDRHRGLALIGQGMDLRGQPAPGATDGMVVRLLDGFLVIR